MRGGDYIKFNKRLLATAIVGTALMISAVMIVSLSGDDKPTVTTNPPPAEDLLPPVTPVTPVTPSDDTESPDDQTVPIKPEEPADDDDVQTEPEEPADDADDSDDWPGNSDDAQSGDKNRGLERAIEAHKETIQKMEQRGQDVPPGLAHSLDKLEEKLELRSSNEQANNNGQDSDHEDNGKHKGNGQDKEKK